MQTLTAKSFGQRVLTWYAQHGRKQLPWQQPATPYRVWLSEIMLQQTQVNTVIPYFNRFIARFPDLHNLAQATIDEVLHLWTGLGYYARARNLHKTAKIIATQFHGEFPADRHALEQLPGIGRSTAAAICALAFGLPEAILDGNVKRVLARVHAIAGWPGETKVQQQLWQLSERYVPQQQPGPYTQAMMDLGAMICTRTKPACNECPLTDYCLAKQQNNTQAYPGKRQRKQLPVKQTTMLLLTDDQHRVLLEKRPPAGIWGGLWILPECDDPNNIITWCALKYHCDTTFIKAWPSLRHTFSHFHLDITPIQLQIINKSPVVMDSASLIWYNNNAPAELGLAKPIITLLQQLAKQLEES